MSLIYFFKGVRNVPKKFLKVSPKGIAIPSIIWNCKISFFRKKAIKELFHLVETLLIGDGEAHLLAVIRVNLEKKSIPIGAHNILIAGTALVNQGGLVANNTEEFSRVSELKLENWYK